jgi:hypothetical protein
LREVAVALVGIDRRTGEVIAQDARAERVEAGEQLVPRRVLGNLGHARHASLSTAKYSW